MRKNGIISKVKIGLALAMSFSLTFSSVVSAEGNADSAKIGMENTDLIVEEFIQDKKISEETIDTVTDEIETLEDMGIMVEDIKDATEKNGEITYNISVTDEITDDITVDKDSNGEITLNVSEGDINNELVVQPDGTIYLDGNKVIFETEKVSSNTESDLSKHITPSSGGITWYTSSKAPAANKKAAYGSYTKVWTCSSINLQKQLGSVSTSVIISLITNAAIPGLGNIKSSAWGGLVSAITGLKSSDPRSTGVSYIDYNARGKTKKRYLKNRRYIYSKVKFKGTKKTVYAYGILI